MQLLSVPVRKPAENGLCHRGCEIIGGYEETGEEIGKSVGRYKKWEHCGDYRHVNVGHQVRQEE